MQIRDFTYMQQRHNEIYGARNEMYQKINKINKQSSNPEQFIISKYYRKNSPYYIQGLTPEQRDERLHNELAVLCGQEPNYHCTDELMLDMYGSPVNDFIENAKQKMHNRILVNTQLNELFQKNNIIMSSSTRLTFTIDSNHKLIVTGNIDNNTNKKIEQLLNSDGVSKSLFKHILNNNLSTSEQYTDTQRLKYSISNTLRKYTGYTLDDLIYTDDNKILTNKGHNISDLLNNSLRNNPYIPSSEKKYIKLYIFDGINKLLPYGVKNIKNMELKINYINDSLSDIGVKYGFGSEQLDWYNSLIKTKK